ncbi:MAG: DUF4367 domain-containing protein [Clostridia bacterium]|nr:DUF4367 domain-containing protein [Clostridia bacterium]
MNEYNERLLKNVLEDYREEQTEQLKKEIEDAKNDPLFQNKEGEAEAFALKYTKKKNNKPVKLFVRVASILLVLAISLAFIPFTVEGRKSSIAEIIANFVNSEFIAFDSNEDDKLLLSYEGKFVPTWIPDGYSVESVTNEADKNEIVFSNIKKRIVFKEQALDVKTNIDYADAEDLQEIEILGYNGMSFKKDGMNRIVITAENTVLYISCNDDSVDLIGFAKKIEKR